MTICSITMPWLSSISQTFARSEKSILMLPFVLQIYCQNPLIRKKQMTIKCGTGNHSLLLALEPENEDVRYYAGSILSNVGNYRGKDLVDSPYIESTLQEKHFLLFARNISLSLPTNPRCSFYSRNTSTIKWKMDFSANSAPTSMGKSFIMHVFIQEQIMRGEKLNLPES